MQEQWQNSPDNLRKLPSSKSIVSSACSELSKTPWILICLHILLIKAVGIVLVSGEECPVVLPSTIRSPIFELNRPVYEKENQQRADSKGTDTGADVGDFAFEAISYLHHMIDDDNNGNVDISESDEFLRDELQYTSGFERQKTLHGSDKQVTIDDLWRRWKYSEVYNWTLEDTVEWLVVSVELPQYQQNFQLMSISGPSIPRIAANQHHYLSAVLGVKNPVHKQKLSLKAMDAVLFGPPKKGHNYLKDLALVVSLVVAVGGCWFAFISHRYSQKRMKKMMQDLDSLQKAEDALKELQEKLDQAQVSPPIKDYYGVPHYTGYDDDSMSRDSDRDSVSVVDVERLRYCEQQLKKVTEALARAETELDFTRRTWTSPPLELQAWLQITYEIEFQHFTAKRHAAERQLSLAKEAWEKIQKRRTAFMGTLRMAHGNAMESVDERIVSAKSALEEVQSDLAEMNQRWRQIEKICGFSIMNNPGLAALKHSTSGEKIRKQTNRVSLDLELEGDEDSIPFRDLKPQQNVLQSMVTNQNDPRLQLVKNENGSQGSLVRHNASFNNTSHTALPGPHCPRSGSHGSLSKIPSMGQKKQMLPKRLYEHRNSAQAVQPISFDLGDTYSTTTYDSDFSSLEQDTPDISNAKPKNLLIERPKGYAPMIESHSQIHPTSMERDFSSLPRNYSDLHHKIGNGKLPETQQSEDTNDDEVSVFSEDSFVSLDSKNNSPKKKRKKNMISKIAGTFRKPKVH